MLEKTMNNITTKYENVNSVHFKGLIKKLAEDFDNIIYDDE